MKPTFLSEIEAFAEAFALELGAAYLAKASGVAGAPALTGANIGKMAATAAASFAVSQLAAAVPAAA